jgi:hypothetical protein
MVFGLSGESSGTRSGRQTLSSELARLRSEHRAERLRLVVAVLRERARLAAGAAGVPRDLERTIAELERGTDRSGERHARPSGRIRT